MKNLALISALLYCALAHALILPGGVSASQGGGATLVFSYPSGFTGSHGNFTLVGGSTAFADPVIQVPVSGTHVAGAVWYDTKQTVSSFTSEFTFQITNSSYGIALVLQNDPSGTSASADANGIGYFTYSYNVPDNAVKDSVAVVFNTTPANAQYVSAVPSMIGLYVNGGPYVDSGISPVQDLTPEGISLLSGDVMDAVVTYDGSTLSVLLTDTTTGTKASFSWPINIVSVVGASAAYVGFTGGCASGSGCGPSTVNSWTWYNGYNTRLTPPTFNPAPGQYTASQTVSISGPPGATIHYTTNGVPPTPASSVYSGPLTVSANEAIQAIAVENNYTTSTVGLGNYLIQSAGSPTVNFPSGFSSANLLQLAGTAALSGSTVQLTDGANTNEVGSAFYVAPVSLSNFSTTYTVKTSPAHNGTHGGVTFVILDQGPTSSNNSSFGLASAPSSGQTTVTLSSPWAGSLCTNCTISVEFSDGEVKTGTFNANSTTVTLSSALTANVSSYLLVIRPTSTSISGGPYTLGNGDSPGINFGAAGIGNSVLVTLDAWNGTVNFSQGGSLPQATSVTGINVLLNPDQVTLSYNGTTLSFTVKDMSTLATFSTSWTINIPSVVGSASGYVGFTASTYDSGSAAIQLTNWTGF